MPDAEDSTPPAHPDFLEATRVWGKIGLLSFGGPAGQIALMHKQLVDERRWISDARFLHALNFCMLMPGPEAQQLATYIGWLLHGWRGGMVAGTLFVLPGFIVILVLSTLYALFGETTLLSSLFFGLKAAVLAIVFQAVIRLGRRALKNNAMRAIAALAFLALFVFSAPFPLVVLSAGLIGYLGFLLAPSTFSASPHGSASSASDGGRRAVMDDGHQAARPGLARIFGTLILWGGLWALPFLLIALFSPDRGAYAAIAAFFSKMALVTFGGAYAVLSYVAQQAVEHYHWLKPGEMLDGLGLAETTPGPLVLVLTFVGFMAGFRAPGALAPLSGGVAGAFLATWVTFIPCFLWIFLGAPWIERLRQNRALAGALTTISAAVTGVILNLALWFALHFLFARVSLRSLAGLSVSLPDITSIDPAAVVLALVALVMIFRFKAGTIVTLIVLALLGLFARWAVAMIG